MAVPGAVVGVGKLITPGGDQGLTGATGPAGPAAAWTTTTGSSFIVPPIGQTVTVTVADTSWAAVGEVVWIGNANGGGNAGSMRIQSKTSNSFTFINIGSSTPIQGDMLKSTYDANNDSIVDHAALSDTATLATTAGTLTNASGNTTDFIDGTAHSQNLSNAVQPIIWAVRQRAFNSIGNPDFSVDQRNVGNSVALAAGTNSSITIDRWVIQKVAATAAITIQQMAGPVLVPGTNFAISSKFLRITITTQQPTLAASEYLLLSQSVEGPLLRELIGDVTSVSVLVRSSVAGLAFGLTLHDGAATPTRSLTNLCTIPNANTWTVLQQPNLPIWASGGTFPITYGVTGYIFRISLACGTTNLNSALGSWTNAYLYGAPGQSNFLATTGSTFDIAFVQHEPGSICSGFLDLDWQTNLDRCLRYYQKFGNYGSIFPTAGQWMCLGIIPASATYVRPTIIFPKRMAKTPTMLFCGTTAATSNIYNDSNATNVAVSSVTVNDSGVQQLAIPASAATLAAALGGWQADTGW